MDEDPTSIPPELGQFFDRLDTSARSSTRRLNRQLQETVDRHDLRRRELLDTQRDATRLHRTGSLPNPTEYWQRSALPRAALLVDPSMAAVVEEGARLGESLERFMVDMDGIDHPWCLTRTGRSVMSAAAAGAIDRLLQAVPSDQTIHALGSWWQRRLRRTATLHCLPRLLKAGVDSEAVIGRTEMELLNAPPWTHGDRLLSAFELAHSEIRTQTELVMEGLTARVARRGKRYLSPVERVTIELRD